MKHTHNILLISMVAIVFSCNSNKATNTHSHDATTEHSHDNGSNRDIKNYFGSYTLKDNSYGTNTIVSINGETRKMVTNALPNHKTGEFPNQGNPNTISAQNRTYTFPVNPKYTGNAIWIREPGVALNGVKFEPGTAEVVMCDTGENYRVEAIQDVIDLGLDFNHAHVQPTGAYHYHGTPTSVIENFDTGLDLVHVGFAHDGFPMYYSKSGRYKSSFKLVGGDRDGEDCTYENPHNKMNISVGGHHNGTYTSDFEYVEGSGDLDECNGITIDGKYMYFVTTEFPYISRCFMGEYKEARPQVGAQRQNGRQRQGQGERLSATDLIRQMDANKDAKLSKDEVKGPLAEQFSKIDTDNDGFLSKVEIEKASKPNGQRRQNRKN